MASFGLEELVAAAAASGDTSSLTAAAAGAAGAPFISCVSFPPGHRAFSPSLLLLPSLRCGYSAMYATTFASVRRFH